MLYKFFTHLVVILAMSFSFKPALAENAHDFSFAAITGEELPLSQFRGKVMLVVNTASRCGFTPQYDDLQALYDSYKDQGLVVIGVPSNDFGRQELNTADEIKTFCEVNFNITFPMADKTVVKGNEAHPFYTWAADELGAMSRPRWNFHKYLVGRDGRLIDWYASTTNPNSNKVRKAVEAALKT